jgi:uncharacterized membrane protein YgdD (TMEM256/DUF423 family)
VAEGTVAGLGNGMAGTGGKAEPMLRIWLGFAAFSGFLAVAAGAMAGHGLAGEATMRVGTGARYAMYHALALLVLAALAKGSGGKPPVLLVVSGWCFIAGSALFSGSLYLVALTEESRLLWATPVGGTTLLVGWAVLVAHAIAGPGRA